ncbi:MAG: response regulator [Myxococcota bacterium]
MKVLVVDDSAITRSFIREQLESAGYTVDEAATGQECIDRISAEPPDLISLDVELPDFDGFEVCKRIRKSTDANLSDLPVVFVTAHDTLAGRARGFEVGGADFVTKGRDGNDIIAAVDRVLRPNQSLQGMICVLVEDSEISRALLRKHLVEEGVTVLEATDGEEGLALVTRRSDEIDMVITDMRMPKMNGDELCARIRRNLGLAHIPVIIVSVVDNIDSVLDVFKFGATDYLLKPYIKEELIARLNSHLHVRMLNKRLNTRIEELRELNRIKDRFLQVVSENLRPPAAKLAEHLEETAGRAELTKETRRELREAVSQSRNIVELMANLLGTKA